MKEKFTPPEKKIIIIRRIKKIINLNTLILHKFSET